MKRKRGQTFAEIVPEVQTAPVAPTQARAGFHTDGTLVDQAGRPFARVASDIEARRALELATAGAGVVWDPCGCSGYCGLTWFTADEVREMVASGPPSVPHSKRRRGSISEWQSHDGSWLLLAEVDVHWGKPLDG